MDRSSSNLEPAMVDFIERHAEKIAGVLSCLDRVVITGTLPDICHAQAATSYLFNHKVRIFDYTRFAEPLRDRIRNHAETLGSNRLTRRRRLACRAPGGGEAAAGSPGGGGSGVSVAGRPS